MHVCRHALIERMSFGPNIGGWPFEIGWSAGISRVVAINYIQDALQLAHGRKSLMKHTSRRLAPGAQIVLAQKVDLKHGRRNLKA